MSEYLVDAAVDTLSPGDARRFALELVAFVERVQSALASWRSGVLVAPAYRRPFVEQLRDEAGRRRVTGDLTASAWSAVAESVELGAQVAAIWRCSDVR